MGWLIYLLGLVDRLGTFCSVVGTFSLIGYIVAFIVYWTAWDDPDVISHAKKARNFFSFPAIICLLIAIFIPSSKTIAAMYLIPKIANNEIVQQIPDKAMNALNLKLDAWIDDMAKTAKDKADK